MTRLAPVLILAFVLVSFTVEAKRKKIPPSGHKPIPDKDIKHHPELKERKSNHRGVVAIPPKFDARTHWPKCTSISTIRDQGQCGTCWAVSAASVLSDRICIASGQKTNFFISANQAASCTIPSQSGDQNCNDGGDPSTVYKHTAMFGLSTGGVYNSDAGCVPYQVAPDSKPPLTCSKSCTNTDYPTPMAQDLKIVDGYWIKYQGSKKTVMSQTAIDAVVQQMQTEIMTNGPITASMTVYTDFQDWDKTKGVYKGPGPGAQSEGGHAIRIIGWDKDEKSGVSYWLIANSWGTEVGEKGVFWLQLGRNTCGIESTVSAPTVTIPNTCTGASFCNSPIDQALSTNIKDSKAPVFLFQGNCVQQVINSGGKIAAVDKPVPIGKVFLGAPAAPITSYMVQGGQLWLLNSAGEAGANCVQPAGSVKFTCGGGSGSGGTSAASNFYASGAQTTWSYYPDNKNWIFDTQGKGKNIGDMITSKFSTVNAMLNLDGTKMLVTGKSSSGSAVSGVMSYPANGQNAAWLTQPGSTASVLSCSA